MALNHLKSQAIVIFLDGNADLPALSPIIRDQQFFQYDDGPVPGGHHFYAPKIVFSDADVTKAFGRVSFTQMKASGEAAIDEVLASIPRNSDAQSPTNGQTASASAPPASSPTTVPVAAAPPAAPVAPAAQPTSVPAANPSPDAVKAWVPPDVMPAQPNWTWTALDGKTYQDVVVTNIEADTVTITHSLGVAHIPINLLPADIRKRLNYNPHAASQLCALIDGKLVSADGSAASTPDTSVQYYAIYYSAQWCPPCHAFTPRLVKWYNAFKPGHPNFELIFVSEDHDEAAMLDYMKEMSMPWPAVRFSDLQHNGSGTFRSSGIEKFAGDGIPDLVLVDAGGKVLSDSYQDGTYVGPEVVVDAINKMVGGASPVPLVQQSPAEPDLRRALISAQNQ
jgi:nucleoredoxin